MHKASTTIRPVAAPPLVPDGSAIDRDHLTRMTLGDASLEHEVLTLFDRQATMLMARMSGATAPVIAALAHTIKGSARGIGAFEVAGAAEALECAAGSPAQELGGEIARLAAAVDEARAAIADLLRAY